MSETLTGRHVRPDDEPERTVPAAEIDDQPTETLAPPLGVPVPTDAPAEQVTCPECGTTAVVALTRRESTDFCVTCDYPLFWTPAKVLLDTGDTTGESLRRLPGTSGRATVGSATCPHCAEGNLLTAEVCVRCGGLMHPPVPEPLVAAPPPPPPAPEPAPEARTPLWVWLLGGATLLLLVALVAYVVATR